MRIVGEDRFYFFQISFVGNRVAHRILRYGLANDRGKGQIADTVQTSDASAAGFLVVCLHEQQLHNVNVTKHDRADRQGHRLLPQQVVAKETCVSNILGEIDQALLVKLE